MPSQVASLSIEPRACANVSPRISSFEKKPANGGMPAMASVAAHMVMNVTGMKRRRPPMLRMSCASSSLPVA